MVLILYLLQNIIYIVIATHILFSESFSKDDSISSIDGRELFISVGINLDSSYCDMPRGRLYASKEY